MKGLLQQENEKNANKSDLEKDAAIIMLRIYNDLQGLLTDNNLIEPGDKSNVSSELTKI
jgi:hypothetical protein